MSESAVAVIVCVFLAVAGYMAGQMKAYEGIKADCRMIGGFTYGSSAFKCELLKPDQSRSE